MQWQIWMVCMKRCWCFFIIFDKKINAETLLSVNLNFLWLMIMNVIFIQNILNGVVKFFIYIMCIFISYPSVRTIIWCCMGFYQIYFCCNFKQYCILIMKLFVFMWALNVVVLNFYVHIWIFLWFSCKLYFVLLCVQFSLARWCKTHGIRYTDIIDDEHYNHVSLTTR